MHCLKQLVKPSTCSIIKNVDKQTWTLLAITARNNISLMYHMESTDDTCKPLRNVKSKSVDTSAKHFVDMKHVKVIAGNGGNGAVSFMQIMFNAEAGPDGGDGGNGGHVVLKASMNTSDLSHLDRIIQAENGEKGFPQDCFGKNANHKIVDVPIGTIVRDKNGKVVADLSQEGVMYIAARGGAGGHGNAYFKSSTQQSPKFCEYGGIGEQMEYTLEVKSMAHFGLIGFPNAGKSTLLRAISRARPKVASYPFTTMKPYLGVVLYDDYEQITVADLPGLTVDSHKNRGLGIAFLKHIERCTALLHIVDITLDEPWVQLETLKYEISQFNDKLNQRELIVVANKMDLPGASENLERLKEKVQLPIVPISAKHGINISTLLIKIRQIYDRMNCNSMNIKEGST